MVSKTSRETGRRRIAIVGGGFCGCALATRLLRSETLASTDIVLIERDSLVGRGVAYASRGFPYLLNVPAGQMSADPQRPGEFIEFARQVLTHAHAADFLPRSLYGDYLEQRLRHAVKEAPPDVRLVRVHGEVTAAAPGPRWRLTLRNGEHLFADEVILALGNAPAAPVAGMSAIPVLDPWSALREVESHQSVLLVGTGLTMVDVAISLAARLGDKERLHALSRRGLLPRAHRSSGNRPAVIDTHGLLSAGNGSLRALLRAMRAITSGSDGGASDWHDVIDALRPHVSSIWQRLCTRERTQFVRHLRPWWDAHRHRLPAEVATRLERLRAAGTLSVHAGHIETVQVIDERIHVSWRPRAHASASKIVVDRVVNCTGPAHSLRASPEPIVHSLSDGGWIVADELGLGLRTGADGEVHDIEGTAVRGLFYVGPLLRAKYWEATAVPELRRHVEATAAALERRAAPRLRAELSRRGACAAGAPAA